MATYANDYLIYYAGRQERNLVIRNEMESLNNGWSKIGAEDVRTKDKWNHVGNDPKQSDC